MVSITQEQYKERLNLLVREYWELIIKLEDFPVIKNKYSEIINLINEINDLYSLKVELVPSENGEPTILSQNEIIIDQYLELFSKNKGLSLHDICRNLLKNLNLLQKDLKKIYNGFKSQEEIFLNLDASIEDSSLLILGEDEIYFGEYYVLALKCLFVIWKNEINLLEESMSKHHRNKSMVEISKVEVILTRGMYQNQNKVSELGKNILEEVLFYARFLLLKNGKSHGKDSKVSNKFIKYSQIIDFMKKCGEYDKNILDKIKLEEIHKLLKDILGERGTQIINSSDKYIKINNYGELYVIISYHKDVKSYSDLLICYENIKANLELFLRTNKFDINDNSIFSNQHYINNNIFFINHLLSMLYNIIDSGVGIDYEKEIKYLNGLYDNRAMGEKSYFTYYKIAQIYRKIVDKNIQNKGEIDITNYLDIASQNIHEAIKIYEDIKGVFYPLSLLKKDILGFSGTHIYSFSGYITPYKNDYYTKIKKEQILIIERKAEYTIIQKQNEFQKINKNTQDTFEAKLHNNNIKIIEILAIFSAIVLFSSSTIQIFQYLTSLTSVILVVLGFSYSLTSFVLLMFLIIKKPFNYEDIKKYPMYYISIAVFFIIFPICLTLLGIYGNFQPLTNEKYKDNIKEEVLKELEQKLNIKQGGNSTIESKIDVIDSKVSSLSSNSSQNNYSFDLSNKMEKLEQQNIELTNRLNLSNDYYSTGCEIK